MTRILGALLVTVALTLGGGAAMASDHEKSDATVEFSGGSVAAGIGFSWGSGTLHYKGKAHKFKVDGLSVGDVGVTSVTAKGNVFHLKKLEDFAGNYTAIAAGAAAGGGGGVSDMRNQNGVEIRAVSTSQGAKVKLGVEGMKVTLE